MNVLVTGGAGYIGGSVATILVQAGHQVTVLDNLCHSQRKEVPAGVRFLEADVADRARVEALLKELRPEGVLHFAALIEAGESMLKPEVYFRNNTCSTLALLEALHATGTNNLVFSSTAAVYGEPRSTPIAETAELAPTNAYGESKLMVEQMLTWFNRVHGLRYASLRYFNVAGALPGRGEAHQPETHIIPLILDVALGRREKIFIYGEDYPTPDGTCIRDYIHVADLADAHILALSALRQAPSDVGALKEIPSDAGAGKEIPSTAGALKGIPSTAGVSNQPQSDTGDLKPSPSDAGMVARRMIYNLGNGSGFSVKQVVDSARRVTGHTIPVEIKPRRPGDPARLVASSERARTELGWQPRHPELDDIVASAWAWHQVRYQQ